MKPKTKYLKPEYPTPKYPTPAQRRARQINWGWFQVLGAAGIGHIETLGNAEDDADLKHSASDCVESIQRIESGPVSCAPGQPIDMLDHDHGIIVCRCH